MISVFICTYNPNELLLKRTVQGILRQDFEKTDWEFAIIDNNSTKPVCEIDFVISYNVTVYVEKEQGLSAARRCAAENANGNILVFVDDDNILNADYLTEVYKAFENDEIAAISGNICPEYVVKPEKWFYDFEFMVAIRRLTGEEIILNTLLVHNDLFPIGAGMAIRKQLLIEYYLDEITRQNFIDGRKGASLTSCEDLDLDLYILYRKKKIGVNPKMKLIHIIPENRTKIEYINKLSKASLKSSSLVNQKWSPIFKHNVFDYFDASLMKIILGLMLNGTLSFIKGRNVKFNFFRELMKYRLYSYKSL